jgi:hypothetical protein
VRSRQDRPSASVSIPTSTKIADAPVLSGAKVLAGHARCLQRAKTLLFKCQRPARRRRVDDHVRRRGDMVGDRVHPRVPRAKRDQGLHRCSAKRRRSATAPCLAASRTSINPRRMHDHVGESREKNGRRGRASQLEIAWKQDRIDQHHRRRYGANEK